MSRVSFLNNPLFLGFDRFERLVDHLSRTHDDTYPPYNIEQVGECGLRITIALAGFAKENIKVTLEDKKLVIRGKQIEQHNKVYIYKGIATRQFTKTFVLADEIKIVNAEFYNGMLYINLINMKEPEDVTEIPIESHNPLPAEKLISG